MPTLSPLKRRDFDRKMRKLGAVEIRGGKGSHRKFRLPDGNIVPAPGGRKEIRVGTQRSIIRRIGISVSSWKSLVLVLVTLVVGIPILLAIFSASGPFSQLASLPTEGALSGNPYSGILSAAIVLIPFGAVAFFTSKFLRLDPRKNFRSKKRRRKK